jgi:hypothetical protein
MSHSKRKLKNEHSNIIYKNKDKILFPTHKIYYFSRLEILALIYNLLISQRSTMYENKIKNTTREIMFVK